MKINLQCHSFLDIDVVHAVGIFNTMAADGLVTLAWGHKETGHQQRWYQPNLAGILPFRHQNG